MELRDARRILLCLRYGIGDVVMETPALAALRATVPKARITALGAFPAVELVERGPWVDAVAAAQDFGYAHWGDDGEPSSAKRFGAWLDGQDFDAVLDASHAVRGAGATLMSRPWPLACDANRALEREALALGLTGANAVVHAVTRAWGVHIPSPSPRLHPDYAARRWAEDFLAAHGLAARPLAAISPAASSTLKRWPRARFAAVAEHLALLSYSVLAFAAPGEESAELTPALTVPPLHLQQTAALLERCTLLVCNDTGLMHMAAAVGCHVVAVFGPTSPRLYAPPCSTAVGADMACPCRKETEFGPPDCVIEGRCRRVGISCIEAVEADAVVQAVTQVAAQGGTRWPQRTGY